LALLGACTHARSTEQGPNDRPDEPTLAAWQARALHSVEQPDWQSGPSWITRSRAPGSDGGGEQLCEAGYGAACTVLSEIGFPGDPRALSEGRLAAKQALQQRACELGEALGCELAGETLAIVGELDRSREQLARACELGAGQGCTRLAQLHAGGSFGEPIPAMVSALFEAGCRMSDGYGCYELANRRAVAGQLASALPLYEFSCRAGIDVACEAQYRWAQVGCEPGRSEAAQGCEQASGGPAPQLSTTALELACTHADAHACTLVGVDLLRSTSSTAQARGQVTLARACEADDRWACWLRARVHAVDLAGAPEAIEASDLPPELGTRVFRHCHEGFVAGCLMFARLAQSNGELAASSELYTLGCEGGDPLACMGLYALCVIGHEPACAPMRPSLPLGVR